MKELDYFPELKETSPHYQFYKHLKNGGKIWRRDELNGVNEVLTEKSIGGADRIRLFGYLDLSIIPKDQEQFFYDYFEDSKE